MSDSKLFWIKQEQEQEKADKKALRKWNKLVKEILAEKSPVEKNAARKRPASKRKPKSA